MMKHIAEFFDYAKERHFCYIKKQIDPSWITHDRVLAKYSFCNVFRELDKTTRWYAQHVRTKYEAEYNPAKLLLATVIFRMFNRIDIGEALFCDDALLDGYSAFDIFWYKSTKKPMTDILRKAIINRMGNNGPYVTGAYIISTPPGYNKLDGVLEIINGFMTHKATLMEWDLSYKEFTNELNKISVVNLKDAHGWFKQHAYLGNFHSYEIVTDLYHTTLLDKASDIKTWANLGPGAKRGLNRIFGFDLTRNWRSDEALLAMQDVLALVPKYWYQWAKIMRKLHRKIAVGIPIDWDMRDVEHTLCEFDKYQRAIAGEGRPRAVYRKVMV
jgi:hypothetical protein